MHPLHGQVPGAQRYSPRRHLTVERSAQLRAILAFQTRMHDSTATRPLVLIVEDEGIIRMGAVESFEEAGFEVLEAADADEAMCILLLHWSDIRALFTDVTMPGGSYDGLGLAFRVSASWPAISLLITSGNTVNAEQVPQKARFMSKPYAGNHAVGHVREMMAAVDTAH